MAIVPMSTSTAIQKEQDTDEDARMVSGILRSVKSRIAGLQQKNEVQEQTTAMLRSADTARHQQLVVEKVSNEIRGLQQKNIEQG